MPRIEEDARRLYEEAAHLTLLESSPDYQQALTTLLRHLDNNSTHARDLIATMLANRDQWLKLLKLDDDDARVATGEGVGGHRRQRPGGCRSTGSAGSARRWVELARCASHAARSRVCGQDPRSRTCDAVAEIWRSLVECF